MPKKVLFFYYGSFLTFFDRKRDDVWLVGQSKHLATEVEDFKKTSIAIKNRVDFLI